MSKEVAYKDATISNEDLPLPIVHYPNFYGTFFGFQKNTKSQIVLCSCSYVALENYLKYKQVFFKKEDEYEHHKFISDNGNFPNGVLNQIQNKFLNNIKDISLFRFENKLCHQCNSKVPSFRYCVEMYGGLFKQTYGWYINKQALEWGVIKDEIVSKDCPVEVLELIDLRKIKLKELSEIQGQTANYMALDPIFKHLGKQSRRIWKLIEDEVRLKFGYKKVGEAWVGETTLYYIIRSLFPKKLIERHYRPDFLNGLELDIFISDLKLGIEYQGIQHFEPVEHWGGEEALEKQEKRDELKKTLCRKNNIRLLYFHYNDGLSDQIVRTKIDEAIS